MRTLNGTVFLETKDIRQALKIGNKTCLELFHKKDFPAKKLVSLGLLWNNLLKIILKAMKLQMIKQKRRFKYAHLNLQKHLKIRPQGLPCTNVSLCIIAFNSFKKQGIS